MEGLFLGMPTLVELNTLEDNIKLCKELKLDFIELNMNLPQFQIDKIDVNRLLDAKKNYNIFFTFHLPEEIDIASFNSRIKQAYLDITKETIEIAKEIESPIINMHMNLGVYFTMPDYKIYLYEKYFEDYLRSIREFGDLVDNWTDKTNIKVAIENTGVYKIEYITEAITKLLEKKSFALTWDIGHDYSAGEADKEYIANNIHKLRHMHIHDAIGKSNHLPLFSGDINIEERLDMAIRTSSSCVIETKTIEGLRRSVLELRKRSR